MRPTYLIILLVLNFFWAAGLSAYKVVEEYLEPGGIVTLRFGLAALSLLVLWPWLPGAAVRGRQPVEGLLRRPTQIGRGHAQAAQHFAAWPDHREMWISINLPPTRIAQTRDVQTNAALVFEFPEQPITTFVGCVLFIGGGLKMGQVVGATDRTASSPTTTSCAGRPSTRRRSPPAGPRCG